jgi:hypothetical protein
MKETRRGERVNGQARRGTVRLCVVWISAWSVLGTAQGAEPGGVTFAPIEWSAVQTGGREHARMAKATRDLAEARDALVALLADRTKPMRRGNRAWTCCSI